MYKLKPVPWITTVSSVNPSSTHVIALDKEKLRFTEMDEFINENLVRDYSHGYDPKPDTVVNIDNIESCIEETVEDLCLSDEHVTVTCEDFITYKYILTLLPHVNLVMSKQAFTFTGKILVDEAVFQHNEKMLLIQLNESSTPKVDSLKETSTPKPKRYPIAVFKTPLKKETFSLNKPHLKSSDVCETVSRAPTPVEMEEQKTIPEAEQKTKPEAVEDIMFERELINLVETEESSSKSMFPMEVEDEGATSKDIDLKQIELPDKI